MPKIVIHADALPRRLNHIRCLLASGANALAGGSVRLGQLRVNRVYFKISAAGSLGRCLQRTLDSHEQASLSSTTPLQNHQSAPRQICVIVRTLTLYRGIAPILRSSNALACRTDDPSRITVIG